MSELTVEVTDAPIQADVDFIGTSLTAFNDADVGPSERCALSVLVRNETGAIVAGLSGYTAWGWLYVQWLFVGETRRGEGLAARMLRAAETEAVARSCHGAYIDTFNPQALKVYQRAGYAAFGELPNFPPGRTRTFLNKAIGAP